MNHLVLGVFDDLARRARQRGFVMMAEVQQELEDASAPADAFDQVVEALDPGTVPDLGALLASREAEDLSAMLAALAMADRPLPEDPAEVAGRLLAWALDRRIEALHRRVTEAERSPAGAPSALLEELIGLERRRRDLRSPQ